MTKADNAIKNEPQDKKQVSEGGAHQQISTLVCYCMVSRRHGQTKRAGQQKGRIKEAKKHGKDNRECVP